MEILVFKRIKNKNVLFMVKFFLCFCLLIVLYTFYWYGQIKFYLTKFCYQIPALVYGRIIHLEPDDFHTKREIISILSSNGYHNVKNLISPGEFHIYKNSIDFIRRSFFFPEGKELNKKIRLTFYKNSLIEIKNLETNHNLGLLRLDPKLMFILQTSNKKKQLYLPISKYPRIFIEILLAVEDKNFYNHRGINFYSIVRAFFSNMISGHTVQGGSTLTQQLVKNLFLNNKRSIWRKANEGFISLIMDLTFSKNSILELYLNQVYLGQEKSEEIYGFPLASIYYFGKPLNELSLDRYALLIGMLKGASLYNPWINPSKALNRRNLVLYLLFKQHVIDEKLYNILIKRSLHVQNKNSTITSHVVLSQIVKRKLNEKLRNKIKNFSGLQIFTTLDPISQEAMYKAVKQGIPILKKKMELRDLEVAVIAIDRFTGEIQAILGGANPNYLGFNRAYYARRSIGSLAKPIIYLTALSSPDKYQLNTKLTDNPISLEVSNSNFWIPKNSNNTFVGPVMLIDAFVHSINVPIVKLGIQLGLKKLVNKWLYLGLLEKQVPCVPSISLGAINLTPIEVSQVFQIIGSGGSKSVLSLISSVLSYDGRLLYRNIPQSKKIESLEATYLTLYSMQETVVRGTAQSLGAVFKNYHIAGKTGTTNNLVDSWFVGIDGEQIVVTWIGRDNNHSAKFYGSAGAMDIYKRYLINKIPKPLILVPPKSIFFLPVSFNGNIDLNYLSTKERRILPIWCISKNKLFFNANDI